jgi:hypothetical protein
VAALDDRPGSQRSIRPAKFKGLSNAPRALLATALARDDKLIQSPYVPIAAARRDAQSLLNTVR